MKYLNRLASRLSFYYSISQELYKIYLYIIFIKLNNIFKIFIRFIFFYQILNLIGDYLLSFLAKL